VNANDSRVADNIAELSAVFARTANPQEISAFFHALFTPREIADIAARWALVKALHRNTPQREIAKDLGVSLCKITRGSKELKKDKSAFVKMIECDLALQRNSNGRRI
jgi:TrpR family trp operon transcriptional repressor